MPAMNYSRSIALSQARVAGSLSAKRLEYFAGSKVLACDRSNFTSPFAPGRNGEKEWSSNLFQLAQRFVAVKAMVVRWIKVGKSGGIRHGQFKKLKQSRHWE